MDTGADVRRTLAAIATLVALLAGSCSSDPPPADRTGQTEVEPAEPAPVVSTPEPPRTPSPAPLEAPAPPARVDVPMAGTVLAHGGGALGRAVFDHFARLCGDRGRLVIIPTASEAADKPGYGEKLPKTWLRHGLAKVDVLHTLERERANEASFVAPIRSATCLWLGGGAQGRLQDAYVGTEVEEAIHALLLRGGAVGGYSAGAAIMSRTMIRRGNPVPEEGTGFGILPGIVLDQHFLAHEREPRLLAMLERHEELVGYGVDEGTWIVVTGDRYEVFGGSVVRRCTQAKGCRSLAAGAKGSFPGE